MAGSLLTMPANGAADWSGFVTLVMASLKGSLFVSLTNLANGSAPAVQDGSYCDINGSVYKLTPNGSTEAIADLAGIANSSQIYFYVVPSAQSVTLTGVITAPTWSETKGGFYNGSNRCIGGCFKDSSGNYLSKFTMSNTSQNDLQLATYRTSAGVESVKNLHTKIIEIGDWNMDTTVSVNISTEGIDATKIVDVQCFIRADSDISPSHTYPLDYGAFGGYSFYPSSKIITLAITFGALFDSANFDETSYNRGFVIIKYFD